MERLAHLAAAIDGRDWAAIAGSFTRDATGYGAYGRGAIVERMAAHLGGVGATQHLIGNHRVTLEDDHRARSLTYARVHHVGAGPMEGSFYECMGEYDDRWTRVDGAWLLTSRAFEIRISLGDFDVLRPLDPADPG